MRILVQKFGGTSVANTEKIANAALKVLQSIKEGYIPVVVVSAMAGVTNQLVSNALEMAHIKTMEAKAEYDAVLANGENITAALMSLALQNLGLKSRSLQAWQIPIQTNSNFSNSFIENISTKLLLDLLQSNIIPVVSGFQGIEKDFRVTTLGRGGSDITAVALAASLSADRCDIYTDVNGIFTADPRFVPNAKKLDFIDYESMLEFSILGAKVLHYRAVEIAMKSNILTTVLSSFNNLNGTIISHNKNTDMENIKLTGIAHNDKIAIIEFNQDSNPSIITITDDLLKNRISVLNIFALNDKLSFTISLTDLGLVKEIFDTQGIIYNYNTQIALISLVGIGINNDLTIVNKVAKLIPNLNYLNVATTKVSFIVDIEKLESTIKTLHENLIDYL